MNRWQITITILLFLSSTGNTRAASPAAPPATSASARVQALLDKIEAAKSIRLIGTFYAQSTTGKRIAVPYESIFERPNRYRATLNYCGCADEKAVVYTVCDGANYIIVDEGTKTVTAGRADQLAAAFRVTSMAQQHVPGKLGIANPSTFTAAIPDKRNGIDTALYCGNEIPYRHEIWLDRTCETVVASKSTFAVPSQPEKVSFETTSFQVDHPIPPETFDVRPPPGFEVRRKDQSLADASAAAVTSMGSGRQGQCRFAFELNGSAAVLLAWSAWDKTLHEEDLGGPAGRLLTATAMSRDEKTRYSLYHAREDAESGHHLRWSIALPASTPVEDRQMWLTAAPGAIAVYAVPLRLDRDRLDHFLRAVQTSLGAAKDQIMSLEQFERLAKSLPVKNAS